jgi:glycosyltransferase involved in cell wall biosynthesis
VITTRGPKTPQWLRDGETAVLVESHDPQGLASAIERVASDQALAARVRAGARALSFGWEEIVEAVTARQPRTKAP